MAKELSEEIIKKSSKPNLLRELSAGGVVFRKLKIHNSKFKILWLVTKSATSEKYPQDVWRLPKGWLDDEDGGKKPGPKTRGIIEAKEEEIKEAAVREVREEGGVRAKILKKIGTERFFFRQGDKLIFKLVTFYLMQYQKDLPEGWGFETERIDWLEYEEACKRLTYSVEKKILTKAKEILDSEIQEGLI